MSYDLNNSSNKIINLPSSTKITSVNLGNGNSIVSFSSLTGTTSPGTIVLSSTIDPSHIRTIYLDGSGRIYHAYTSAGGGGGGGSGGDGQVTDSGHQEFNLVGAFKTHQKLNLNF